MTLLQDALWRHAVLPRVAAPGPTATFDVAACGTATPAPAAAERATLTLRGRKRLYRRTPKSLGPRTYRTRVDPFAGAWEEIEHLVAAAPERTATSILAELQARHPGRHPDGQLRTLQRGISALRAKALLAFSDGWLNTDAPMGQCPPARLHLVVDTLEQDGTAARALPARTAAPA